MGSKPVIEELEQWRDRREALRLVTNEKNKYLTTFESLPNPVIILDENNRVDNINHSGALLFQTAIVPESMDDNTTTDKSPKNRWPCIGEPVEVLFPWITDELKAFIQFSAKAHRFEKEVETVKGINIFQVRFSRMLDVSGNLQGAIIILEDITDRKKAEDALGKTTRDFKQNIKVLDQANRQILKQQKR